jgi:molybdate transport system substrate-binding protein
MKPQQITGQERALQRSKQEAYRSRISPVEMAAIVLVLSAAAATPADADDVHVMISGGFTAVYNELGPPFEKKTGNRLITVHGPSMGTTTEAIPVRLKRGEEADVVIVARSSLDHLADDGFVLRETEKDLVRSPIGLAVRKGAPVPDISTVDGLKETLINAKSIAFSDSASGVYVSGELFNRLGIASQVRSKSRMIEATPVGEIVAAGDADVGFQQMSELLPVSGITVVGPIPAEVQKITVFSAAVGSHAKSPKAAKALIAELSAPSAAAVMRKDGLEPASP